MQRVRVAHLIALALTVALGIGSRRVRLGVSLWDKSLGDALYAVAVYLVLALLLPRLRPLLLAGIAFAFCLAVELFQLTGIPERYAAIPPVRWLLGTRFAVEDILCYAAGVALIGLLEAFLIRRPPADKHVDAT